MGFIEILALMSMSLFGAVLVIMIRSLTRIVEKQNGFTKPASKEPDNSDNGSLEALEKLAGLVSEAVGVEIRRYEDRERKRRTRIEELTDDEVEKVLTEGGN